MCCRNPARALKCYVRIRSKNVRESGIVICVVDVSNAARVVFPDIGVTKGDVVAYYERMAPRLLAHVALRPVSIKRFPKGLSAPGFFQKNVPPHYPESIERFRVPRSQVATKKHARKGAKDPQEEAFTVYPILTDAEHLPYLANQGAIELHVPTAKAPQLGRPDRIIFDLDPPEGELKLVREAAHVFREALAKRGLASAAVATGSKGFHVVAPIRPAIDADVIAMATQKLAALLTEQHHELLTVAYRIALRGRRVFVDWLRNQEGATVVAPYSLRARPRASVATPIAWDELDATKPDAFTIADAERLLDRPDSLAQLQETPGDGGPFVEAVNAEFDEAGLVLQTFDRFRS